MSAKEHTPRIAFIGLGLMGLPMSLNLVRAGYPVTGHTRTPSRAHGFEEAGGRMVDSAESAVREADVVITMLPDTPDVVQVATGERGIFAGARRGLTWIDMSTISPTAWRSLDEQARKRGIDCLDAPVSGGDIGARQGTLLIMVGGEEKVFERCRPVFERLGKTIIRIGGTGAGQVAKACNQVILGATIAGVAEALVYGAKAGVDPAVIRQALLGGFAQSRVLEVHGQRMLEGVFKPGFYLRLHEKDLHIATEEGRAVGVALPVTALVDQLMNALIAGGMGELDDSVLVRSYEKLAGHSLARAESR